MIQFRVTAALLGGVFAMGQALTLTGGWSHLAWGVVAGLLLSYFSCKVQNRENF